MPHLSEDETNRIALRLASKLAEQKQTHWVESEVHFLDHEWIKHHRESEKGFAELKGKIMQSAVVWAVLIALGYSAKLVWKTFITTVKTGM